MRHRHALRLPAAALVAVAALVLGTRAAHAQTFTFALSPSWSVTVHGTNSLRYPVFPDQRAPGTPVSAAVWPSGAAVPPSLDESTTFELTFAYTGPGPVPTTFVPINADARWGFGVTNVEHVPTTAITSSAASDGLGDPEVVSTSNDLIGGVHNVGHGGESKGTAWLRLSAPTSTFTLVLRSSFATNWGAGDVGTSWAAPQQLEIDPPGAPPAGAAVIVVERARPRDATVARPLLASRRDE